MRPDNATLLAALNQTPLRRASGIPLYLQAAGAIERALLAHPIAARHPLPPENDLARALGVSRPTLRQSVHHLAQQGILFTQRGVGTFPVPATLTRPLGVGSLHNDLRDRGLSPTTKVISITDARADEETATELGIPLGSRMIALERVRFARELPVALISNLVALDESAEMTEDELTQTGLYEILHRKFGIELVMATQRVSAKLATKEEAAALQLPMPTALLRGYRLSFDAVGNGIDKSVTLYPHTTEISSSNVGRQVGRQF